MLVSDPKSPSYGKYLTAEQLRSIHFSSSSYSLALFFSTSTRDFVSAPPEVESRVLNWLQEESLSPNEPLTTYSYGDVLKVGKNYFNTKNCLQFVLLLLAGRNKFAKYRTFTSN